MVPVIMYNVYLIRDRERCTRQVIQLHAKIELAKFKLAASKNSGVGASKN